MTVFWEESGWERLGPGAGRSRLPVWDCTAGLIVGERGALMVDAGSSRGEGARLRAEARRLLAPGSAGPGVTDVTHLALTHPHFDHVLGATAFTGAETFGAAGVDAVLVHRREELVADAVRHGLDPHEAAEAGATLLPVHHQVSGERTLDLGGVRVVLATVGPAHTAHDLVVLVPGEPAVVFCGDLVEESGEPQAGPDAVPAQWPAALDRLLELGGEDARYVPGHGAVVDAAFVRAQRDTLAARFGVS
ncbi:MBL fold metallo-hydrolase [Streptomyces nodosus]|uniref:MBL fold metallo-hydrolase n=1 Tax=Streptomyces nodosus TaxID=40318 RepID=A0A0B5DJK8_9ACTN|nr:MBL fold metallo-hydrolase [Streptomyces nodosus]AJE40626.1 metallo-beta-lactamase [Streptomyces nodosus]MBB4791677.1 glyoxylase-like metal-dependent hydrolase (beta-lactamase superfamily II) [Streptomyces nodosus]QEV39181.1 MBL fold metallo-hydrolase [Streptomyces nodosus]